MKKRNVPKEERETIVNFNEAEDTATIYTFNTGLKKRLAAFAEKYPKLCKLTIDDAIYGSVTYEIQKSRVSIRLVLHECQDQSGIDILLHELPLPMPHLSFDLGAKLESCLAASPYLHDLSPHLADILSGLLLIIKDEHFSLAFPTGYRQEASVPCPVTWKERSFS